MPKTYTHYEAVVSAMRPGGLPVKKLTVAVGHSKIAPAMNIAIGFIHGMAFGGFEGRAVITISKVKRDKFRDVVLSIVAESHQCVAMQGGDWLFDEKDEALIARTV